MAKEKLTKRLADSEQVPGIIWDTEVPGFGFRTFPSGARSWIAQYRSGGRTRRLTLGSFPPVTPAQARREAVRILAEVRVEGRDPAAERKRLRGAPTVDDLAKRFAEDHMAVHNGEKTRAEHQRLLDKHIIPTLGRMRVANVTTEDVARLHGSLRATPVLANRVLFLASSMFGMAGRWHMIPRHANPATDVDRFPEATRERYLSQLELRRLGKALGQLAEKYPDRVALVRLLLLTGCRRGEVCGLRWKDIDRSRGTITIQDHKTSRHSGPKVVPLSQPALAALGQVPKRHEVWLFPNPTKSGPMKEFRKFWEILLKKARIEDLRPHDLRHTFASYGAMGGTALHTVGALLGHTKAATTERYAHLADSTVKDATESIGKRLAAEMSGKTRKGRKR